MAGPGSVGPMAGQGRAVGSWRLALLWHHWGRDWQAQGADMGSCAVGRWGEPREAGQRQSGLIVLSGT